MEDVIAGLPPSQKEVITLRDIEGWSAREVCNILEISETNQRSHLPRCFFRDPDGHLLEISEVT